MSTIHPTKNYTFTFWWTMTILYEHFKYLLCNFAIFLAACGINLCGAYYDIDAQVKVLFEWISRYHLIILWSNADILHVKKILKTSKSLQEWNEQYGKYIHVKLILIKDYRNMLKNIFPLQRSRSYNIMSCLIN